jgi:hypothetical protein
MTAPRRPATSPPQSATPPAVAHAITMLARIDDALTRLDHNVSALCAQVADLTTPAPRQPQPRPVPRHATRPPCQRRHLGQPAERQCATYRRKGQ